MTKSFEEPDYKMIAPRCQFSVYNPSVPELESDCGEPAIYKVWWGDDEDKDNLKVCKKHLYEIFKEGNKQEL